MSRLTISIFSLLFVFTLFIHCTPSNSSSRRPVTSIQLDPQKKNYKLGEEIRLNLQTKIKDGSIEKIEIFLDGKKVQSSNILTNSILLKTTDIGLGKHNIKISATKKDGVSGENYSELFVASDIKPIQYTYQIIAEYPHNMTHFTQGLEFHDNQLYEGTGLEGSSSIYRINLQNGKSKEEYKLDNQYFGEGITILNNKVYELTYKNDIGFVYDLSSFKLLNTWKYKSAEGWGLTNDGHSLIMSDGTENIYYISPDTYREERKIQVCDDHAMMKNLNELEYIKGEIWANIWTTDNIVIIDPKTGKITGEINLSGLSGSILQSQKEQIDVLNGIAWNPNTDKIYVTGKLWPKIFEIKLVKSAN